jgi:hypothetical protein
MDKPTSRIGGDFSAEVMEQFRNAYAKQLVTPDEDTVANNTGLPTNVIPNTSPWIEHTGLWKAHDGRSLNYQKATPFNPDDYLSLGDEEVEIDAIVREALDEVNEEGDALVEDISKGDEEKDEEDIGLSEEEVDALINEILESES